MTNEEVLEKIKATRREHGGEAGVGSEEEVMSEAAVETLARRLDRLERQNRLLKRAGVVALVVISTAALMGQATTSQVAKQVEAEAFIVRDPSGRVVASLGAMPDGGGTLMFFDAKSRPRAMLGVAGDGSPGLTLAGKAGNVGVTLFAAADGSRGLEVYDGAGKRRAVTKALADGSPRVGVTYKDGKSGKSRVHLSVLPPGSPQLILYDKAGKVIWSAP
jgi:hypothetical protein